jgi:hypothetical protein
MTVTELIGALQGLPGDMVVVMSIDPEGNGFQELYEVATGMVWDGEDCEDPDEFEKGEDIPPPCVCLWP